MYKLGHEKMELYVPNLRQELIQAARQRRLIYYGAVQNRYGGRGYIGQVLDEINRREHKKGNPMLSAIVVDKDSGTPGEGFVGLYSELYPNFNGVISWEAERDRVWGHTWA